MTGEERLALEHPAGVRFLAWSPDGRRIVFGQKAGAVRVFNATNREELLTLAVHSDDVWHATWSPNGMRIVSGDESGEVKVWDAATGREVLSFRAPDAVYSVNWSPEGNYVIAGGYFNPPVIRHAWQSTEELIAYAKECCVTRELTRQERQQFGLPER
jgi:WD40 repeat protein